MGIVACRMCGAKVQTRRDASSRAGFCSLLCAKRGRERSGEFVARAGTREGEAVAFPCECGALLRAPAARAGSRLPCTGCGIQVWVPDSGTASPGLPSIFACAKCGRNVKTSSKRCMYCGSPIS